jgi:hypothetical protein
MLRRVDHFHTRGCVGIHCLKLSGSIKRGRWKAARPEIACVTNRVARVAASLV